MDDFVNWKRHLLKANSETGLIRALGISSWTRLRLNYNVRREGPWYAVRVHWHGKSDNPELVNGFGRLTLFFSLFLFIYFSTSAVWKLRQLEKAKCLVQLSRHKLYTRVMIAYKSHQLLQLFPYKQYHNVALAFFRFQSAGLILLPIGKILKHHAGPMKFIWNPRSDPAVVIYDLFWQFVWNIFLSFSLSAEPIQYHLVNVFWHTTITFTTFSRHCLLYLTIKYRTIVRSVCTFQNYFGRAKLLQQFLRINQPVFHISVRK